MFVALLCTRHHFRSWTYVNSINFHNCIRYFVFPQFTDGKNQGIKRLSNLPTITHAVSGRAETGSRGLAPASPESLHKVTAYVPPFHWPQVTGLSHSPPCPLPLSKLACDSPTP